LCCPSLQASPTPDGEIGAACALGKVFRLVDIKKVQSAIRVGAKLSCSRCHSNARRITLTAGRDLIELGECASHWLAASYAVTASALQRGFTTERHPARVAFCISRLTKFRPFCRAKTH
jgi:hypothetical protein